MSDDFASLMRQKVNARWQAMATSSPPSNPRMNTDALLGKSSALVDMANNYVSKPVPLPPTENFKVMSSTDSGGSVTRYYTQMQNLIAKHGLIVLVSTIVISIMVLYLVYYWLTEKEEEQEEED